MSHAEPATPRPAQTPRTCPVCAYDLRGLADAEPRCPECGTGADELRRWRADWTRRLRRTLITLVWAPTAIGLALLPLAGVIGREGVMASAAGSFLAATFVGSRLAVARARREGESISTLEKWFAGYVVGALWVGSVYGFTIFAAFIAALAFAVNDL